METLSHGVKKKNICHKHFIWRFSFILLSKLASVKKKSFLSVSALSRVNYSDVLPWQSGQPNGEEKQPCGLLTSAGRLFDMTCSEKVCFNCHFKKASHFTLRGLCDDSMLDKRYTMSFSSFDERYSFKVGRNINHILKYPSEHSLNF